MDISIPDSVEFFREPLETKPPFTWRHYCFKHAILAAIEGVDVKIKLTDYSSLGCDVCLEERASA